MALGIYSFPCRRKVAQLKERIKESAKVQEGDACKRTFHHYRENIQSQFGITVECNKSDIVLQLAFVRYFKQRWYVVGVKSDERRMKNSSAAVDVRKLIRVLPFDRISFLKLICEKHPLPAKMKWFLTPENYYEDSFGIYRMEDMPVEKICIRAFYSKYNYIEEVPLHESLQRMKESKDGMFREYTLTVRPQP